MLGVERAQPDLCLGGAWRFGLDWMSAASQGTRHGYLGSHHLVPLPCKSLRLQEVALCHLQSITGNDICNTEGRSRALAELFWAPSWLAWTQIGHCTAG